MYLTPSQALMMSLSTFKSPIKISAPRSSSSPKLDDRRTKALTDSDFSVLITHSHALEERDFLARLNSSRNDLKTNQRMKDLHEKIPESLDGMVCANNCRSDNYIRKGTETYYNQSISLYQPGEEAVLVENSKDRDQGGYVDDVKILPTVESATIADTESNRKVSMEESMKSISTISEIVFLVFLFMHFICEIMKQILVKN